MHGMVVHQCGHKYVSYGWRKTVCGTDVGMMIVSVCGSASRIEINYRMHSYIGDTCNDCYPCGFEHVHIELIHWKIFAHNADNGKSVLSVYESQLTVPTFVWLVVLFNMFLKSSCRVKTQGTVCTVIGLVTILHMSLKFT